MAGPVAPPRFVDGFARSARVDPSGRARSRRLGHPASTGGRARRRAGDDVSRRGRAHLRGPAQPAVSSPRPATGSRAATVEPSTRSSGAPRCALSSSCCVVRRPLLRWRCGGTLPALLDRMREEDGYGRARRHEARAPGPSGRRSTCGPSRRKSPVAGAPDRPRSRPCRSPARVGRNLQDQAERRRATARLRPAASRQRVADTGPPVRDPGATARPLHGTGPSPLEASGAGAGAAAPDWPAEARTGHERAHRPADGPGPATRGSAGEAVGRRAVGRGAGLDAQAGSSRSSARSARSWPAGGR